MAITQAPRTNSGVRRRGAAVDWEVLRSFHEFGGAGDGGIVEHLVQLYLSTAPGHLQLLRQALDAGDADSCVFTAHTMKGTAATIGARDLATACRALETAARAKAAPEHAEELLQAIYAEFERVREALDHRPPFLVA